MYIYILDWVYHCLGISRFTALSSVSKGNSKFEIYTCKNISMFSLKQKTKSNTSNSYRKNQKNNLLVPLDMGLQ